MKLPRAAIYADTLSTYLNHVVYGRAVRDMARKQDVQPSTISRRIARCELRREHPDWDAIFSAFGDAWAERSDTESFAPTADWICQVLGTTAENSQAQFVQIAPMLAKPNVVVLIGDAPQAAVVQNSAPIGRLPKPVALSGLALGWLEPFGPIDGKVRRHLLSDRAKRAALAVPDISDPNHVDLPGARNFVSALKTANLRGDPVVTEAHVQIEARFRAIYIAKAGIGAGPWAALTAAISPRLLDILTRVCGEGQGFYAVESILDLPNRSVKMSVLLALETFDHLDISL